MGYIDITHCLKILNERSKWFFQKENIAAKLQCLDAIKQHGTPNTIHSIIGLLSNDNVSIQEKAAETVLHLFSKLKSLNDYALTLKHLPINKSHLDFYRVDFDETTYIQLLGIASLNRNGYVREKAVRELARLKDVEGLKFILLRLGDWVEAVRRAANDAVTLFLEDAYFDAWLRQLPAIDWLLEINRVDLGEIHSRILQFIVNRDFSDDLFPRIEQLDDKSRFRFYRIFLHKKSPSKHQVSRIARDKNFLVRAELLKHLALFDQSTQTGLLELFLQDKSVSVRLKALYASKPFSPMFDHKINVLLCDEGASVRELSRRLLAPSGTDFAQLYRARISRRQFLAGSIPGLSETGSREDLPIFKQHIHARGNKLVIASLTAINKLDSDTAKRYALELIVHTSKRIRNKAGEILAKQVDGFVLEKIRAIYVEGDYEIKTSILKIYSRIGGWTVIGDLLLSLGDENVNIQNFAWQLIQKWKSKATRLFTTPAKADIERANSIYENLDQGRLNMTEGRRDLFRELKFYLG